MHRPFARFSLAYLMGLVFVVALGLAAMRVASTLAVRVTFTLSVATLLVGTLAAIVRRSGGIWPGFALFGWCYALMFFVPAILETTSPYLVLTSPLGQIAEHMHELPHRQKPPRLSYLPNQGDGELYVHDGREFRPATAAEKDASRDTKLRMLHLSNAKTLATLIQGLLFALSGAFLGRLMSEPRSPAFSGTT